MRRLGAAPAPTARRTLRLALPLAALVVVILAACQRRESASPSRSTAKDTTARETTGVARETTAVAESTVVAAPPETIRYVRFRPKTAKALKALRDSLGPERWTSVLMVNRVDSAHVHENDRLIVPLTYGDSLGDSLALSPFPRAIEAVRDTHKLFLVSLRVQAFAAYDSGRLVRWGPVSTGRREKPTPVGLFHTNWKDKERISTIDEAWLLHWYLNLHNFDGVSMHEYELPGRPVSHSCVRLLERDAIWAYAWAEEWRIAKDRRTVLREGTPVVVFGEWDWNGRAPWKRLPEHPLATRLGDDEIEESLRVLREAVRPRFGVIDSTEKSLPVPRKTKARPDTSRAGR